MNDHFHTDEYYKELTYKTLTQGITPEEDTSLREWLEYSAENRKIYEETRHILELSLASGIRGKFDINKHEVWEKISERIKVYDVEESEGKTGKSFHLTVKVLRIAASFLIVFFLGALTSWWLTSRGNLSQLADNFSHEIVVPKGGKSRTILPDGTEVWLNAGTVFRYEGSYGTKNRNVFLQGEAYFHVKKNPKMPFVVQTSELKIKALGTSFDVKAYKDEKYISTTLDEGVVKIEGKGVNLTMKPKQNITYYKKSIAKETAQQTENAAPNVQLQSPAESDNEPVVKTTSNVNTQLYTAWKDNKWVIESENLGDIAVLLERKFNVSVRIDSPELLNYKFTGTFSQETLEQILKVIRLSAPLKYNIENGVVTLQIDKKRRANYLDLLTP
ncbi:MAG TPA: FecR family protein [Bacteroidales bacterium]